MEIQDELSSEAICTSDTGIIAACGTTISLVKDSHMHTCVHTFTHRDAPPTAADADPCRVDCGMRVPLQYFIQPPFTEVQDVDVRASNAGAAGGVVPPDPLCTHVRVGARMTKRATERVACARWSAPGIVSALPMRDAALSCMLACVTSMGRTGILAAPVHFSSMHARTHTLESPIPILPAAAATKLYETVQPTCLAWRPGAQMLHVPTQAGLDAGPARMAILFVCGRAGVCAVALACVAQTQQPPAGARDAEVILSQPVVRVAVSESQGLGESAPPVASLLPRASSHVVCVETLPGFDESEVHADAAHAHADAITTYAALGRACGDVIVCRLQVSMPPAWGGVPNADAVPSALDRAAQFAHMQPKLAVVSLYSLPCAGGGAPTCLKWTVGADCVLAFASGTTLSLWQPASAADTRENVHATDVVQPITDVCWHLEVAPVAVYGPSSAASEHRRPFNLVHIRNAHADGMVTSVCFAGVPASMIDPKTLASRPPARQVECMLLSGGSDGWVLAWSVQGLLATAASDIGHALPRTSCAADLAHCVYAPRTTARLKGTTPAVSPDVVLALLMHPAHASTHAGDAERPTGGLTAWLSRERAPPWSKATTAPTISCAPRWISLHPPLMLMAQHAGTSVTSATSFWPAAAPGSVAVLAHVRPFLYGLAHGIAQHVARVKNATGLCGSKPPMPRSLAELAQAALPPLPIMPLLMYLEHFGAIGVAAQRELIAAEATRASRTPAGPASNDTVMGVTCAFVSDSPTLLESEAAFPWGVTDYDAGATTFPRLAMGSTVDEDTKLLSAVATAILCCPASPPAAIGSGHLRRPHHASLEQMLTEPNSNIRHITMAGAVATLLPCLLQDLLDEAWSSSSADVRIGWLRVALHVLRWVLSVSPSTTVPFKDAQAIHRMEINGHAFALMNVDARVPPCWTWYAVTLGPHVLGWLQLELVAHVLANSLMLFRAAASASQLQFCAIGVSRERCLLDTGGGMVEADASAHLPKPGPSRSLTAAVSDALLTSAGVSDEGMGSASDAEETAEVSGAQARSARTKRVSTRVVNTAPPSLRVCENAQPAITLRPDSTSSASSVTLFEDDASTALVLAQWAHMRVRDFRSPTGTHASSEELADALCAHVGVCRGGDVPGKRARSHSHAPSAYEIAAGAPPMALPPCLLASLAPAGPSEPDTSLSAALRLTVHAGRILLKCPICGDTCSDLPSTPRFHASVMFNPAAWMLHEVMLHPPHADAIARAQALMRAPVLEPLVSCARGHMVRLDALLVTPTLDSPAAYEAF